MSMERNENDSRPTRRNVLRAGAGALVAGTASLGSGCVATLPPLGQRVRFGRVDAPAPGEPIYRKWIPEVRAVDRDLGETFDFWADHISFSYGTPNRLGEAVLGRPYRWPRAIRKTTVDYFGQGFDTYDGYVTVGSVTVLLGDVQVDAARAAATEGGYRAVGSYSGYETFARSDVPRAVAIGDDAILWGQGERAEAAVRTVLDARTGRVPRAYDTREDLTRFTDSIGAYPWLSTAFPAFFGEDLKGTDPIHDALSFTFDRDGAYYVDTSLFPADNVPSQGRIRDALESSKIARTATGVDVTVDGRIVTIEAQATPETYRHEWSGNPEIDYPQVTWSVERDRASHTVTIRHSIGDSVNAAALSITVNGATNTAHTQFSDRYDRVNSGDSVTVDLTREANDGALPDELYVSFSPPSNKNSSTMLYLDLTDDRGSQ